MSYLSIKDFKEISKEVKLISIRKLNNVQDFSFDSQIEEYNNYLEVARAFDELDISKTFLLIHKKTCELLAYMTLSADSIKLTPNEKQEHDISKVPYASVPALKVGKLAVNRELSDSVKRKGYGSFLLEAARAFAYKMNEIGVACRFLTVDADIEYDENTTCFYEKNGFVVNLCNKSRKPKHTVSMRKDIFYR